MYVMKDLFTVAQIVAKSGYSEDEVLSSGMAEAVFFLVKLETPDQGLDAFQVPQETMVKFVAGADSVTVDALEEVYSHTVVRGPFTIVRNSLMVVGKSWNEFVNRNTGSTSQAKPFQGRSDQVTPAIEYAQSQCRNPDNTSEVWGVLSRLADEEHAPFLASTPDGLKYKDKGETKYFKRGSLDKRLHPEKRGDPNRTR